LAKYAAEGVDTYLVTATRGERGWSGDQADNPGLEALGRIREAELHAAADVLGLHEVNFLNYIDGDLDRAEPEQAVAKIAGHIRRVKPHVVVTFDPFGSYGHPDHIAICQFTTAACVAAADASYGQGAPHRVSKLYYFVDRKELIREFEAVAGEVAFEVNGVLRRAMPWENWAITTWVDVRPYWRQVWQAALCHTSQAPGFVSVGSLPEEKQQLLWGTQTLYRAFSLVNAGPSVEHDLFEGLR
jgi:LmbE family N-acetylglucosaminyl deacetylase